MVEVPFRQTAPWRIHRFTSTPTTAAAPAAPIRLTPSGVQWLKRPTELNYPSHDWRVAGDDPDQGLRHEDSQPQPGIPVSIL